MPFHRNADEKIKEAIAKGEFDNLPGKGKPLDLDTYFATPEHLRMGYSILKSADIIPEEMEFWKQIEGLKKSLDSCTSQIERRAIQKQLSEKKHKLQYENGTTQEETQLTLIGQIRVRSEHLTLCLSTSEYAAPTQ